MLAVAVIWVLTLLVKPFGKCWLCRGNRVTGRGHMCRACNGAGRRQRLGSRTVHQIRRHLAAEIRRSRAPGHERHARETGGQP